MQKLPANNYGMMQYLPTNNHIAVQIIPANNDRLLQLFFYAYEHKGGVKKAALSRVALVTPLLYINNTPFPRYIAIARFSSHGRSLLVYVIS